jgi:hypothetical protein
VPRWAAENKCYSCHNNGDGARALYIAAGLGYAVPAAALDDTTRWLLDPKGWEKNRGDANVSDKKLARIQFAATLAVATNATGNAMLWAAELLVRDQDPDGSWRIEGDDNVGSPVTYGSVLATVIAREAIEKARMPAPAAKARNWLARVQPRSTLDAAAIFYGVPERREELFDRLAKSQTPGGGWGPQMHSPAEPFDTAMVMLALARWQKPERTSEILKRGRAYLLKTQQAQGGWPETTRPAGAQSYAQHISTSAWATLALLASPAAKRRLVNTGK